MKRELLLLQISATLELIENGLVADLQKGWPMGALFLALTCLAAGMAIIIGRWLKSPAGFIRLAISFIFLAIVTLLLKYDSRNGTYILAQYLTILWVGLEMMRFTLNSLGVKRQLPILLVCMLFLVLGTGAITYVRLSSLYAHGIFERYVTLYTFLGFVAKLTASLGICIFMMAGIPALTSKVPERYRRFFILTSVVGALGVVTLLVLWVREQVIFDIWLVLALSLLSVLISAYALFYARSDTILPRIYPIVYYDPDEYAQIRTHARRFVFFILAYAYWAAGRRFFHFGVIERFLKDINLVQTSLYTLDLATLINAVLALLFFYSCLIIATKYLRVLLKEKYAETLFQNLGLLLVFFFTVLALDMPWQVLAALTGAFSVGLGIGSSVMVGNYLACLSLLFSGRLRVGDTVEIPGEVGRISEHPGPIVGNVREIGAMLMTIRTFENVDVYIPNSLIFNERVANYSAAENGTVIRFLLDDIREIEPDRIKSIISEVLKDVGDVRVKAFNVRIVGRKNGGFQAEVSLNTNLRFVGNPKDFLSEIKERLVVAFTASQKGTKDRIVQDYKEEL